LSWADYLKVLHGSLPLGSLLLDLLPLLLALLPQGPLLGLHRSEKHQIWTVGCTAACGSHALTLQTTGYAHTDVYDLDTIKC